MGEKEVTSTSLYKGSRYDRQTSFDDPNRWNARYIHCTRVIPGPFLQSLSRKSSVAATSS